MAKFVGVIPLLSVLLATDAAQADAFLDHATPLVGSTVAAAPHELTWTFTQSLAPAFSTVTVTGSNGARRCGQSAGRRQYHADRIQGGRARHLSGALALAVDIHSTQGSFTFQVGGQLRHLHSSRPRIA